MAGHQYEINQSNSRLNLAFWHELLYSPLMIRESQTGSQRRLARPAMLLVIAAVVLSLIVAVTTRFTTSAPIVPVVQTSAAPSIQHMNRDAVRWAPPVQASALLLLPSYGALELPREPVAAAFSLEESLSNRPPPLR